MKDVYSEEQKADKKVYIPNAASEDMLCESAILDVVQVSLYNLQHLS